MRHVTGRAVLRVCAAGNLSLIIVAAACLLWPVVAAAQSLPAGWAALDVGQKTTASGMTGNGSTFTVVGRGIDIAKTSDEFTFVYRQVSGDVDIIARVASLQSSSKWAKAGVMVRASLNANAAHATIYDKISGRLTFRRRPATGLSTLITDAGEGRPPVWVKLERRGSAVTSFRSADGVTWKMTGSETLSLPSAFYVGLITLSGSKTATATAQFTNVTVAAPGTPANTPPQVSLWSPADKTTVTAPAVVSLAANASDADNGVAQVEFYANNSLVGTAKTNPYTYSWTPTVGTYTLTAVARDTAGATATSTARTITVNGTTTNPPPTVSLTAPAAGATYSTPATVTISASAADANGFVARVDFYAGSTLVGSATSSPYSVTWTNAPAGSHSLTAVARDNQNASTISAARNITVSATSTNSPPTVSLTAPAAGTTYTAPASMAISANAADTNGSVTRVDFYAGSALVGSDTTSPYSVTWSNAGAGSYSLTAVAYDNQNASTTSAARAITVNAPAVNTPPTVSLTAPAAGSGYTAPASVTIAASAADTNGYITRVDFFAGATLVGSDTTSPYSVTWNNAPGGSFTLTAVARDNGGASTTSAPRSITINNPAPLQHALFTPSPDHATVVRYVLDVFTAGANPATATPITSQDLGKPPIVNGDCNADIAATISGLPGGNYFATVVAISAGGTSTRTTSAVFAR
jgi:hypothetical protein